MKKSQSNPIRYSPPSKLWRLLIYPIVLGPMALSVYYIFLFLTSLPAPSSDLRKHFSLGIAFLIASGYLLAGYRYICWASGVKNDLLAMLKKNRLIVEHIGRYFINEDIVVGLGKDPIPFKRLQQRDIRDVLSEINRP